MAGTFECAGRCVDFTTDPEHCGNCGSRCPDGAAQNGFPLCVAAECAIRCGDGPNGPLVPDLEADVNHCGACGLRCPTPLGGEARCADGECLNPCQASQAICDGRCTYVGVADNCLGADECCPVVAEGQYPVPVLRPGRSHAVRIQLAERRRVQARLNFNNGGCPGYTLRDLPHGLLSNRFIFSVKATNLDGNPQRLARGVKPKGDDTACALLDVDLDPGAYLIDLQGENADTTPGTVTWHTSAPAALADLPPTVQAAGSYRVAVPPGDDGLVAFLRLAQPARLRLRFRERVRDYPVAMPQGAESCTGRITLAHVSQPDDPFSATDCGEVDRPVPAGDYRVRLTHRWPMAGEGRLEVGIAPIQAVARDIQADDDVPLNLPLPLGQVHALAFDSLGGTQIYRLDGAGCADAAMVFIDDAGRQIRAKSPQEDCGVERQRVLGIGPHTLWIFNGELRGLAPVSLLMNGLVEADFLRPGIRNMPALAQGADVSLFIDMPQDGRLLLEIRNANNTCTGNPDLYLYNSNNQQLIYDDDSGPGNCPRILHQVTAGRYRVRVRGNGGLPLSAYPLSLTLQ